MTRSLQAVLVSSVIVAGGLLPGAGQAQTQSGSTPQNGIWQTTSASSSRPGSPATDPAAAAPASRSSTGASSWSAGRSSFGGPNVASGATAGAGARSGNTVAQSSGSSSWTAGRGSFGSSTQQNQTWNNKAGFARTPGTIRPANGPYTPPSSQNLTGDPSRFNIAPRSIQPAHAVRPSLAGAHASGLPHVGALSPASKHSHGGAAAGISTKPVSTGLRSHTGPQGRGRTSIGAQTKSSRLGSTTQAPFNSTSTFGDSTESTSGGSSGSKAPQQ